MESGGGSMVAGILSRPFKTKKVAQSSFATNFKTWEITRPKHVNGWYRELSLDEYFAEFEGVPRVLGSLLQAVVSSTVTRLLELGKIAVMVRWAPDEVKTAIRLALGAIGTDYDKLGQLVRDFIAPGKIYETSGAPGGVSYNADGVQPMDVGFIGDVGLISSAKGKGKGKGKTKSKDKQGGQECKNCGKLGHWQRVPHLFLGLAHSDREVGRRCGREALAKARVVGEVWAQIASVDPSSCRSIIIVMPANYCVCGW